MLSIHPDWGCLLTVFSELQLIDHNFYGNTIFPPRMELKKLGIVVDFDEAAAAANAFAHRCKHRVSSSFSTDIVMLFLSCYRSSNKYCSSPLLIL